MRHCRACGRALTKDHHDREKIRLVDDEGTTVGYRMVWTCRVRRLADHTAPDLASGERKVVSTFVPGDDVNQRTKGNNLRWTPIEIIQARKRAAA